MIYPRPQCEDCKYLDNSKPGYQCKAFLSGIPEDILTGEFDHSKIHPDQKNDIVFEEKSQGNA